VQAFSPMDKETYDYGFDAQTGEFGNLIPKGIIDPTKVVRAAPRPAAPTEVYPAMFGGNEKASHRSRFVRGAYCQGRVPARAQRR
jgi:hypothetical protein